MIDDTTLCLTISGFCRHFCIKPNAEAQALRDRLFLKRDVR